LFPFSKSRTTMNALSAWSACNNHRLIILNMEKLARIPIPASMRGVKKRAHFSTLFRLGLFYFLFFFIFIFIFGNLNSKFFFLNSNNITCTCHNRFFFNNNFRVNLVNVNSVINSWKSLFLFLDMKKLA
jgi:hypothetical protein